MSAFPDQISSYKRIILKHADTHIQLACAGFLLPLFLRAFLCPAANLIAAIFAIAAAVGLFSFIWWNILHLVEWIFIQFSFL